jgi:DegV family protein with EDD domain
VLTHEKRGTVMKIAVLTDTGSALNVIDAQKYGLYLLPLQVIDEEVSYQDGVDITTMELYERLKKNHTPKTSMPILSVIENQIAQIKADGYDAILSLPLSSGLSSTYNAIEVCGKDLGIPVVTIENYTTCDLQGYGAILAKHYVDEGKSIEEVKALVEEKVKTSGTLILPNDLQHLKRGGRLTPLAAAAAGLLKIKPILRIDPQTNGKIDVFEKVRTEKKAISFAVDYIIDHLHGKPGKIFVIHSDCLDRAQEVKHMLLEKDPTLDIETNYISAVISAHTGLDCIAIQYIEK